MLQTTCKKTNQIFEIVGEKEGKIELRQIETNETKTVAQSTLNRWFTKPEQTEQVELQQVELEQPEQLQQVEQVETQPQQVETEQPSYLTQNAFVNELIEFAVQNGCNLYNAPQTIVAFQYNGLQVGKIVGKKEPRLFVNPKKVSDKVLCELMDSEYKGRVLTYYTWVTALDVCKQALLDTIQHQKNKTKKAVTK